MVGLGHVKDMSHVDSTEVIVTVSGVIFAGLVMLVHSLLHGT